MTKVIQSKSDMTHSDVHGRIDKKKKHWEICIEKMCIRDRDIAHKYPQAEIVQAGAVVTKLGYELSLIHI